MKAREPLLLCLAVLLPTDAMGKQQKDLPPIVQRTPIAPRSLSVGEATLDDALEIDGESVDAKAVDTRMMVGVRINGRGPFRFLVDSGADRSAIGARLAASLQLPSEAPVIVHGIAGASRHETARIKTLTIGSTSVADIIAPLLAERNLGARGLLGIDALRGQRLKLDFEAQTITVEDTRVPAKAEGDEIIVTARRRAGQLILTQARASGVGLKAVVDTGSQLTIGNLALRDALLRRRRLPADTVPATIISVTGEAIVVPVAIIPELQIGGIIMRQVPIAFGDLAPFSVFDLNGTPAILLGTDVMSQFRRVSLDFAAKKVRFQLNHCRLPRTASSSAGSQARPPFPCPNP